MTKCLANAVISELVRIMITYVRQRLQCRFYSVREQFEDFLSMSLLSPRPCYLARFCMGFFRKTTIITIKVVTYTTDDFIYFFLDSSFVVSGSTTDSKKISVAFSCIRHHSFFCDSLSSDNIACSKRLPAFTKPPCFFSPPLLSRHAPFSLCFTKWKPLNLKACDNNSSYGLCL